MAANPASGIVRLRESFLAFFFIIHGPPSASSTPHCIVSQYLQQFPSSCREFRTLRPNTHSTHSILRMSLWRKSLLAFTDQRSVICLSKKGSLDATDAEELGIYCAMGPSAPTNSFPRSFGRRPEPGPSAVSASSHSPRLRQLDGLVLQAPPLFVRSHFWSTAARGYRSGPHAIR